MRETKGILHAERDGRTFRLNDEDAAWIARWLIKNDPGVREILGLPEVRQE